MSPGILIIVLMSATEPESQPLVEQNKSLAIKFSGEAVVHAGAVDVRCKSEGVLPRRIDNQESRARLVDVEAKVGSVSPPFHCEVRTKTFVTVSPSEFWIENTVAECRPRNSRCHVWSGEAELSMAWRHPDDFWGVIAVDKDNNSATITGRFQGSIGTIENMDRARRTSLWNSDADFAEMKYSFKPSSAEYRQVTNAIVSPENIYLKSGKFYLYHEINRHFYRWFDCSEAESPKLRLFEKSLGPSDRRILANALSVAQNEVETFVACLADRDGCAKPFPVVGITNSSRDALKPLTFGPDKWTVSFRPGASCPAVRPATPETCSECAAASLPFWRSSIGGRAPRVRYVSAVDDMAEPKEGSEQLDELVWQSTQSGKWQLAVPGFRGTLDSGWVEVSGGKMSLRPDYTERVAFLREPISVGKPNKSCEDIDSAAAIEVVESVREELRRWAIAKSFRAQVAHSFRPRLEVLLGCTRRVEATCLANDELRPNFLELVTSIQLEQALETAEYYAQKIPSERFPDFARNVDEAFKYAQALRAEVARTCGADSESLAEYVGLQSATLCAEHTLLIRAAERYNNCTTGSTKTPLSDQLSKWTNAVLKTPKSPADLVARLSSVQSLRAECPEKRVDKVVVAPQP